MCAAAATALGNQGDQSGTATSVYRFTNFTVAGLVSPLTGAGLIFRTARTHHTRQNPGDHAAHPS